MITRQLRGRTNFRLWILGGLLVACAWLTAASPLRACPACQDAVVNGSGKDDDDPYREARAYNHSIYMMVGTPYTVLFMLGFLVYRGHKTALKNARTVSQTGADDVSTES